MSPYKDRPARSFWRSGVTEHVGSVPPDLYFPKFKVSKSAGIATAGSCFAQHLGRNLKARDYNVIDVEPPPAGLDGARAQKYGYEIYSARYGNIYTVRQFLQLMREVLGRFSPAEPVWEANGRFYDSQRPSVEPNGLATPELVLQHRAHHLAAVRRLLTRADVLVFTLGLTEVWEHAETGTVYSTAPGTIAGTFDRRAYRFRNLTHSEILSDFHALHVLLRELNPSLSILLTVSPVPLTATATDDHVLVATTYSKSVLRSVAGELAAGNEQIDYFPSYEIITGAPTQYRFFEPNMRSVAPHGVAAVMATFFGATEGAGIAQPSAPPKSARREDVDTDDDVVCEEALLEAFAK